VVCDVRYDVRVCTWWGSRSVDFKGRSHCTVTCLCPGQSPDVSSGAGAATGINLYLQSSGEHAANKNLGIVSAGLGARGPEGGDAKSKSAGVSQPCAESKVDKTVVATLGQLSAHFAIWRVSKDGFLRISSSHGAPEDIVCSEHAVALMNHIISADGVVPSDSKDFKQLYKVCF